MMNGLLAQAEGGLWRAVGIMAAAGTLRGCVLLLRKLRLPDAAMAFAHAAAEAGFATPAAASDGGRWNPNPRTFH